jgi:phage baseplate assembly protein W
MAQLLVDTADSSIVIAPASVADEIVQNVRMIITTPKGSVPLDRDFGLDFSVIDRPAPVAKALLDVEIVSQVARYEPRARVDQVIWNDDQAGAMDGRLLPQVMIDVEAA